MKRLSMLIAAAVMTMSALQMPIASAAGLIDPGVGPAARGLAPIETAGCIRWGLSGYHWYSECLGPSFLYPHHCVVRHGIKFCH